MLSLSFSRLDVQTWESSGKLTEQPGPSTYNMLVFLTSNHKRSRQDLFSPSSPFLPFCRESKLPEPVWSGSSWKTKKKKTKMGKFIKTECILLSWKKRNGFWEDNQLLTWEAHSPKPVPKPRGQVLYLAVCYYVCMLLGWKVCGLCRDYEGVQAFSHKNKSWGFSASPVSQYKVTFN